MSQHRALSPYRSVQTHHGDTLQKFAARELGDASRWHEIAWLNKLQPPYITDDPTQVSDTVILSGSSLKLPASTAATPPVVGLPDAVDDDILYGIDINLKDGDLSVTSGDITTVSGVKNLVQAIRHILQTSPGEVLFHQQYGCSLWFLIGDVAKPRNAMIARSFVSRALLADVRIARIQEMDVAISGDTLKIDGTAEAIDGRQIPTDFRYGIPN